MKIRGKQYLSLDKIYSFLKNELFKTSFYLIELSLSITEFKNATL
jgi:hypothetical protein